MGSYWVAFLAGGLTCVNGRLPMDLPCGNEPICEALQEDKTGLVG
jgi:hypothetical protein